MRNVQYISARPPTHLEGSNKSYSPDADGYRTLIVGAYNITNTSGLHYPHTSKVEEVINKTSHLRRRLNSGLAKGEYRHPKLGSMSRKEKMIRVFEIDELLVSHAFREIYLRPGRDHLNREMIFAVAETATTGPYGEILNQSLSRREENVAFSIRSLTRPCVYKGKRSLELVDAIAYDHVSAPGVPVATKFDSSFSLEGDNPLTCGSIVQAETFYEDDLLRVIEDLESQAGLESTKAEFTMVRDKLGWTKVEVISPLRAIDI